MEEVVSEDLGATVPEWISKDAPTPKPEASWKGGYRGITFAEAKLSRWWIG